MSRQGRIPAVAAGVEGVRLMGVERRPELLVSSMSEKRQIGKYELIALIARGGMGDVYLARTGGLGGFHKLVVVKTLKSELAEDEKFRSMFLDEAKLAARLSHRHIVQTNDVGESEGVYYLIMEYLDGRSLAVVAKRAENVGEPLDLVLRVRVLTDMLAGLHHAHELVDYDGNRLGVVHRDVCPANVLVTFDGQVRVVDFGVAKTKNQAHETQAGTIKGRVAYMSPEHVASRGLDHRADVFSTGIMLWEALTNQRFWGGRPEAELLGALVRGELPQLPDDSSIPVALREVCTRALALQPDDRFPTAHAMRMALEEWLAQQPDRHPLETLKPKMAVWFERERAHVAKLIATSTNNGAALPLLEPALSATSLPSTGSGVSASMSRSRGTSPTTLSAPVASIPSAAMQDRSASRVPLVAGAATLVALFSIVGWRLAASAPAPAAGAGPAAIVSEVSARLVVQVVPAAAQIFVDGVAVAGNPFTGSFPLGSAHDVRASADGYDDKSDRVLLTESTQLRLTLDARAPVAPVAPVALGGAAAAMPGRPGYVSSSRNTPGSRTLPSVPSETKPVEPTPAKAPTRGVDSNNPYAKPDAPGRPARPIDSANPYGH